MNLGRQVLVPRFRYKNDTIDTEGTGQLYLFQNDSQAKMIARQMMVNAWLSNDNTLTDWIVYVLEKKNYEPVGDFLSLWIYCIIHFCFHSVFYALYALDLICEALWFSPSCL